jgi:DNA-binding transcriptional regulator YiaG
LVALLLVTKKATVNNYFLVTKLLDPKNEEFLRLEKASGWSRSEIARRLELSTGLISQYGDGKTRPSKTVLKLFRLLLQEPEPAVLRESVHFGDNFAERKPGGGVPRAKHSMKTPSEDVVGLVLNDEAVARRVAKITANIQAIAKHDESELDYIERMTTASAAHARKKKK